MFDKNKPNNNLSKLPKLNLDFEDIDLLKQLNKTNEAIAKLNWTAKSIPNQEILLEFVSIKEWIKSNEIESIHTTVKDAFISELFDDASKIKMEDKETINYKEAIYYWHNKIKNQWWIWFNDILEINRIITWSNAWIYSSPDKKIEIHKPWWQKEVSYTPPVWKQLIKDLLYNLEEYYNNFNEETEIDPILKLPILHYQFEAIHPFWDWNWRTWRILMVLYFVLFEKLDLPILFISDFITERKAFYYKCLRNIDSWIKGSDKRFTLWLLKWIQAKALEIKNLIYEIQILIEKTKIKIIKDKDLRRIYSKELIDFLFIRPFYTVAKMEQRLWIHKNTASKYLNLLESKWILKSTIIKKTKIFHFKGFLDLLE